MTIDEIIKYLPAPICCDTVIGKTKQKEYDAHDSAVIILRKYQRIEQIMNKAQTSWGVIQDTWLYKDIREVLEDGNSDMDHSNL